MGEAVGKAITTIEGIGATAMPMLVAEELEVGLDQIQVEHAPPDDKLYALPGFGIQLTGTAVTAPALANAVFAATGKRVRKLPLERQLGSG